MSTARTLTPELSIAASPRWAFLAPYFAVWHAATAYGDRDHEAGDAATAAAAVRGLQFDAFHVYLPDAPVPTARTLRWLGRATELVGRMLALDANAWWFVRGRFSSDLDSFRPSDYDATTLHVPTMLVLLRRRFTTRDDPPGAVAALQRMLTMPQDDGDDNHNDDRDSDDDHAFFAARARVLAMAMERRHHQDNDGRRVRLAVQLTPAATNLGACLVDTIALVRAVQRETTRSHAYPFTLAEIRLSVYATHHVRDAHFQLRELLALNVPVTLKLRRTRREGETLTTTTIPTTTTVSGAFYAALATDVDRPPPLTLHHREVYSSCALWSAVACAPSVTTLVVDQQYREDPAERMVHATWLAYALRMARSLETLVLTMYEPTPHEFQAMRAVAEAFDPTRQLVVTQGDDASTKLESASLGPQTVTLRADAEVTLSDGTTQSLASLGVSTSLVMPLVDHDAGTERVRFVVPGYLIGSAPASSVVSIHPPNDTKLTEPTARHGRLTSLSVYSDEERSGVASSFVDVFARGSLRHFCWMANESLLEDEDPDFDADLDAIVATCPHLESVTLQHRKLATLDAFVRDRLPLSSSSSSSSTLRSVSLVNVPVPLTELVRLFETLADRTKTLTRTLETLEYCCVLCPLGRLEMDAALAMLRMNRRLTHVRLGVARNLVPHVERLVDAERSVRVPYERLALRAKLALLSAVRVAAQEPLGALDAACVATVFEFFVGFAPRHIELVPV